MSLSTIAEYKIQSTLEKIFYEKFGMSVGIGFNSTLTDVKIINILILSGNLNQPRYKYLLDLLQPYLVPTDSCIINQLNIDLTNITWDEMITLIRLV